MIPWLTNFFGSPWLLWGVGLAGAPLVIHLLYRRRFRETPWAAMRFLLEAARKNARRLQVEQWLLLALRTLILLVAVLALAEPHLRQAGAVFQAGLPTHRIVVVDASASMGAVDQDQPLFENARRLAREVLDQSRPGDAVNLVRLSALPPRVIVQTPSFNADSVRSEIDRLELSATPAAVAAALEETLPLLQAVPEISRKQVYLISDFQRASWEPDRGGGDGRLAVAARKISESAELFLLDAGSSPLPNAALTSCELIDRVPLVNRPTRLRVGVRNYAAESRDMDLQLLVDDRVVDRRTLSLGPGAEQTEIVSLSIDSPGLHRIEARLPADALEIDNHRWLAANVRDRLRILCVQGRSPERAGIRGTDYLPIALAPATRPGSLAERNLVEPVVIDDGEFTRQDTGLFDAIFLNNVRRVTEREAATLQAFLRQGGGVVIAVGDGVDVANYNEVLFRDGAGLLPARLQDRRGDPVRRDPPFRFDPAEFAHPILEPFRGNPDAGLESTLTFAHLGTSDLDRGGARIVLQFDSGEPAILEKRVGLGPSLLITTSLDERWGLWPLWPSFVPLIQEIALFAVSGRETNQPRVVGDTLEAAIPPVVAESELLIVPPQGEPEPIRPQADANDPRLIYGPTTQVGLYEARIPPPAVRSEIFAVNFDTEESNLSRFSLEELRAGPLAGIESSPLGSPQAGTPVGRLVPTPASSGWTRPLLYLLIYLMFAEQLLAWNFAKGLWLLCPPLALYRWWRG